MIRVQKFISLLLAMTLVFSSFGALSQEDVWTVEKLDEYLLTLSEEIQDPWQKAIYEAGAENMTPENDGLTFYLRSFTPVLKGLPKRTEDPEGWLAGFFDSINSYELKATLAFKDGQPTQNGVNKLKSTVRNAAIKAKEAMNQQAIKTALLDLLFPIPYKDAEAFKKGAISPAFEQWMSWIGMDESLAQPFAALLYGQMNRQLSFNKGPHSLQFTVQSVAPTCILTQGEQAVMDELVKITLANSMDEEQLICRYYSGLLQASGKLRRNASEKRVFLADLDDLAVGNAGEDYDNFLASFTFEDSFYQFEGKVRALPDYPALDYPANGRMSGNTSGIRIDIKVPKDGYARYIQVRNAYTDNFILDAFIRPGGSTSVRVPKGVCYMLIAMGNTWYGEEALFGDESILSKTDDMNIVSSQGYIVTLGGVEKGNLPTWGANESMFKK
jgi:hypothetical protein